MKRYFIIFLVVFLLAGCAREETQTLTGDSTGESQEQAVDFYNKDSEMERLTLGAVRAYNLPRNDYSAMLLMRNKLLLMATGEVTQLTVLSGEYGEVVASGELALNASAENASFQATNRGFCYYLEAERKVVFLDTELHPINTVQLPEGVQGSVLIDPKTQEIYYCAGVEMRAFNPETGLSRLIKQQSCKSQKLLEIHFSGAVVTCEVTDEQGITGINYISTKTGETLSKDNDICSLQTDDESFFAIRQDGIAQQQIIGNLADLSTMASFNVELVNASVAPAFSAGGIVTYVESEQGFVFSYFHLSSGIKTAAMTLVGESKIVSTMADNEFLWILATNENTQAQTLYRWEIKKTPITEDTVYTGPLYTSTAPDVEGLKACQQRVDDLNHKYGVAIRIYDDAVKYTGGYTMEKEFQVSAINKTLDALEQLFSQLPNNFLDKTADGTDSGKLRICIVRSLQEYDSAQFWYDENAFIILPVGSDVVWEFLQQVGYVVDSHNLGNTVHLDNWNTLNPNDFSYGKPEQFSGYLSGDKRAFIDATSMNSLIDDRSRIFAYAMSEKGKDCFNTSTMQAKLKQLCVAIRDTYDWKKNTEILPWEQYLKESIAYKAK